MPCFPADKRELMEKYLLSPTPTLTLDESLNDFGFSSSSGGGGTLDLPVTSPLETETVSRLSREVASLSAEIITLNNQLNSALRGVCNSGDMGSDGLLLLLERKLQGYKLDTLLSGFKVELNVPDGDVEDLLFSRAQEKVTSLANRAKAIVSAISSQSAPSPPETEEEDVFIRIKRKRVSGSPCYSLTSLSIDGPACVHGEDELSFNITKVLQDYRDSSAGQPTA